MKESSHELFLIVILGLFVFSEFFIPNVYAYLDPGTGSAVFQVLIGVLVGVGITLKIYWVKLRMIFQEKFSKS